MFETERYDTNFKFRHFFAQSLASKVIGIDIGIDVGRALLNCEEPLENKKLYEDVDLKKYGRNLRTQKSHIPPNAD